MSQFDNSQITVPVEAMTEITSILQRGSSCELKVTKEGLLVLENRRKKVWPMKDVKSESF